MTSTTVHIFVFSRHSATYVTFRKIFIQNFTHFGIKFFIYVNQPFRYVFMYGLFRNIKMRCRRPYGRTRFYNVFPFLYHTFGNIIVHIRTSAYLINMRKKVGICRIMEINHVIKPPQRWFFTVKLKKIYKFQS